MPHPRFSLIIPAYNEAAFLPRLLRSVHLARRRYRGGVNEIEIVVADNRSEDETAEIARRMGCRVATEEKRNIAAVRNAGARAARGAVLVFTDADGWIHPETFNVIDAAIRSGRYVAGATGVRLERYSMGLALTMALAWPLLWLTKFDTGAVFCRREDFDAVGGYRESRAFAEDIAFLLDMWHRGRRDGRRLVRLTSAKAVASTRKFDKYGDWHYFDLAFKWGVGSMFSKGWIDRVAETYWYGRQRPPGA